MIGTVINFPETKIVTPMKSSFENTSKESRRRQQIVFLFCFLVSLVSAWHNLLMPFLAPSDFEYSCSEPNYNNLINFTREESPEISKTIEKMDFPAESNSQKCFASKFQNSSFFINESQLQVCEQWKYNTSYYGSTLVSEFNLVCERKWLISFGQSIFMSGYVSAMLVYGYLSDRVGRRPTAFIALTVFTVSGFLCLTSPTYLIFTIFRFFVSMGVTGAGTTAFILLMELVNPKERSRYGVGFQFGWSTGYVILPGLAWFIRDWFYLQLVTIIPSVVLLAFWWIVPESPRWLKSMKTYSKRNFEESNTTESLRNELEPKESILEKRSKQSKPSFLDLIRTKNMRKKTLVLFFCWFVNSFIYFGLSLNTGNLGGNPYLNFFISGAIEFPAYIIATHLIRIVGRRKPQMIAFILGGLACLFTIPLMQGPVWLKIGLAMSGKFCITASFAILYVISAELFPTVVRTVGVGACSVSARIASMIAPFIKELGEATHPSVPFAVFGTLSVLSGLSVLLLPETHMTNLPDTLEDGEDV